MPPSLPCEWDNDFWADERSFPLDAADVESPLKPEELQVLRAQYEKEGEYVGLQTKFNYAWVRLPRVWPYLHMRTAPPATSKLIAF
jgi:E3 ubiquitin-protein ligase RNF115/126